MNNNLIWITITATIGENQFSFGDSRVEVDVQLSVPQDAFPTLELSALAGSAVKEAFRLYIKKAEEKKEGENE